MRLWFVFAAVAGVVFAAAFIAQPSGVACESPRTIEALFAASLCP